MPVKNAHQRATQKDSTIKRESMACAFRRPGRKAHGTRFGTLADWREAGNSGKVSTRYGQAIRDGR